MHRRQEAAAGSVTTSTEGSHAVDLESLELWAAAILARSSWHSGPRAQEPSKRRNFALKLWLSG